MKKQTIYIIIGTVLLTVVLAYFQYCTETGKQLSDTMSHCGGTITQIEDCNNHLNQKNHE